MNDGLGGAYLVVYDGIYQPEVLSAMVNGLTICLPYIFILNTHNFKGVSLPSPYSEFTLIKSPEIFALSLLALLRT